MTSAPQPGTVLAGKYRVEEVLGVGGMGAVVAAHHLQLDQRVAIKYLLPEAIRSPEVIERFAREARAAAKIRGEHVARVIDVGRFDDGAPYIVMECLDGHDLAKELLASAPLRVADVARYLLETCEALAEAHAARIVHRDLKPQNLFLAIQPGKRSIIKVLDFGISKVETDVASAALTKTSALMGTAFYMSPEQMTTPKLVDHRSDIWSLGVILYELLAGKPPFFGDSVAEVIAGILTNEPENLRQRRPDIPSGLVEVAARCMQSKPADRFPHVAALAAALAPFASPNDRKSVEITARVLGQSEPAGGGDAMTETVALATLARGSTPNPTPPGGLAPPPALAVTPSPTSLGPTQLPPSGLQAPAPTSSAGVAPVTTHALARSAGTLSDVPKSKAPLVLAGVGVVAVLSIGAVAVRSFVGRGSLPAAAGVVATPGDVPSAVSSTLPVATPTLPSLTTASASANAEPPIPGVPAPGTSPVTATGRPGHVVVPNPKASASAMTSAPSAVPSVVPASVPAASAASSAGKNPLQMGIK